MKARQKRPRASNLGLCQNTRKNLALAEKNYIVYGTGQNMTEP
jgi:hypothetical protein